MHCKAPHVHGAFASHRYEWLVAKITAQVTHKWIPVFVHPKSPLFEGIKGLRYLHVASKAVSALVELTMTLVYIDF